MPDEDVIHSSDAVEGRRRPLSPAWFRRLSVGRRTGLVVVLLMIVAGVLAVSLRPLMVRGDSMSYRYGRAAGFGVDIDRTDGRAYVSKYGSVRGLCTEIMKHVVANADDGVVPWSENSQRREIKIEDFDEASFVEGCIEGFMSAHRGLEE